ncbi:rubrerythrin-like domain-containing protein [Haladaptatus sp. AB618]|uniref:rubrerythrin-like domain-containing protein n=1 Tax=Haladaptatus sp. AB618 TaxID=2934173 RepID=UPI00209C1F5C|nr:rubrerythrin-like domain-containing protein [Haladaptatus sp. AB618]MCO8255774.1 rubrerythrin-like domain-containing protein [Haladaptatus sp. AB618]
MSIVDTFIKRYRSKKEEEEAAAALYECVVCGETASAATSHIVCPECGGKLERIELLH